MSGNLIAPHTIFGWTLQGPTGTRNPLVSNVGTFYVEVTSYKSTHRTLQAFWDLEHLDILDTVDQETNDSTLQRFQETVELVNGCLLNSSPTIEGKTLGTTGQQKGNSRNSLARWDRHAAKRSRPLEQVRSGDIAIS